MSFPSIHDGGPEDTAMKDRWLSAKEISTYLGVKQDTIYKWIFRKNLPAAKVGRLWKFKKAEVDRWVKSGGAAPKPGFRPKREE